MGEAIFEGKKIETQRGESSGSIFIVFDIKFKINLVGKNYEIQSFLALGRNICKKNVAVTSNLLKV